MIKKILLLFLVTIVSLKISDFAFDKLYNPANQLFEIFENYGNKRNIILKEHNPNKKGVLIITKKIPPNVSDNNESYNLNIDSNGFIKNGNKIKKYEQKQNLSIIFFGGSTTECLYVTEKNRFPSILERNLSEKFQRNVNVFNSGVSANHSLHSLLNLISKGIIMKPDYVVLMHNVNDLSLLRKTDSYWTAPESRSIIQTSSANDKNKNIIYLMTREVKNLLVPNIYRFIVWKIQNSQNQDEFKNFRDKKKNNFANIKNTYVSSLKSFISISRIWNIEPILMTQFNRINNKNEHFLKDLKEDDIKVFIEEYKKFNEIIKDVAKSENVSIVDLAKKVPSNEEYMYDSVHLTENGSKLVGEILTNFFENKLKEDQLKNHKID